LRNSKKTSVSTNNTKNRYEVHDEITRRNSGNACYSFKKLLASCLLSKMLNIRIYKTIYFTSCFVYVQNMVYSPEKHKLQASQNIVLSKIFKPKEYEICQQFSILHNKEYCDLYRPQSLVRTVISSKLRCAGHVAKIGAMGNAHRILVGKPLEKCQERNGRITLQ
jgi:hypothetical protein